MCHSLVTSGAAELCTELVAEISLGSKQAKTYESKQVHKIHFYEA